MSDVDKRRFDSVLSMAWLGKAARGKCSKKDMAIIWAAERITQLQSEIKKHCACEIGHETNEYRETCKFHGDRESALQAENKVHLARIHKLMGEKFTAESDCKRVEAERDRLKAALDRVGGQVILADAEITELNKWSGLNHTDDLTRMFDPDGNYIFEEINDG